MSSLDAALAFGTYCARDNRFVCTGCVYNCRVGCGLTGRLSMSNCTGGNSNQSGRICRSYQGWSQPSRASSASISSRNDVAARTSAEASSAENDTAAS